MNLSITRSHKDMGYKLEISFMTNLHTIVGADIPLSSAYIVYLFCLDHGACRPTVTIYSFVASQRKRKAV